MIKRTYTIIFLLVSSIISQICFAKTQDTTEFILDNGLKIIVREDHTVGVVVSQIWYKVGSSYEKPGITGISHMLEHMMFKGTKDHPGDSVFRIISELGGEQNAGTLFDATFYFQKVQAKYLEKCFELEADRMKNLVLNEKEFLSEREVVSEERRLRYENDPNAKLSERFNSISQIGSPYHHPIIGWMHDINNYKLEDLKLWYQKYYSPNNAILVVVGDVVPNEVYKLAKKYFGSIKPEVIPQEKVFKSVPQMGELRLTLRLPARIGELIIGYNVPSIFSVEDRSEVFALIVASGILGQGKSSRLNSKLVVDSKVAAMAAANYDFDGIHDKVFILRGIPSKNVTLKALEEEIIGQVNRLKENLVSEQELNKIKTGIVADEIYSKDSMFNQAFKIGIFESIGLSYKDEMSFVNNIKAVTAKQVQDVVKKYFSNDSFTVATLIPIEQN